MDSGDARVVKRILHVVQLERLDDRLDLLHLAPWTLFGAGVMPNQGRIWKAVARKVD